MIQIIKIIDNVSLIMTIVLLVLSFHFFVYFFVAVFLPPKKFKKSSEFFRYGVIIPARNEQKVIAQLIDSIKKQDYPSELIDIFVVADNCTDNTAQIARQASAIVYERFDNQKKGKGYALDYVLNKIFEDYKDKDYKGFFFFDADNLLAEDFIGKMNDAVAEGHKIITGYRMPKNYDQNWVAAGSGMIYLEQSRIEHRARTKLNTSTHISGTGFYVDYQILKDEGGWPYRTLTEDLEFSHSEVLKGHKIIQCYDAVFYDEQPSSLKDMFNQRIRWVRGNYICMTLFTLKYFKTLFKTGKLAAHDLNFVLLPIPLITFTWGIGSSIVQIILAILSPELLLGDIIIKLLIILGVFYGILAFVALTVTVLEWKKIIAPTYKKILYAFTFPINMASYVYIIYRALFKIKGWKPITRANTQTIDQLKSKIK
ncbi:MAG: glycosyltransferase family 2 protein [Clostridiales bacterium]|nr:glycosyltransferase family 2 protein [Clostridiales bacterium]